MAHNIFGNRFYGHRQPGWHKLGIVNEEEQFAVETFSMLGGYWFDVRPITGQVNGADLPVGKMIVRSAVPDDPTEKVMGFCTDRYNLLQPQRICELIDENVGLPIETMGMLGSGERIFVTIQLNPFDVGKGDTVKPYMLITSGFDGKNGATLSLVTLRVVCDNTLRIAIQESLRNKSIGDSTGRIFTGLHTSKQLEVDLAAWLEHVKDRSDKRVEQVQEAFEYLHGIDVTDDYLNLFLNQMYPKKSFDSRAYPHSMLERKEVEVLAYNEKAETKKEAVRKLFSGKGTAIEATRWGVLNCVTELENWSMAKKDPSNSIMFGARNKEMVKALNILME